MNCCDNAPKTVLFSNQFLSDNKDNRTVGEVIGSLGEESVEHTLVDLDYIKDFIKEAKKATTLKQLSSIPNIDEKFEASFKFISRGIWYVKELEELAKIFSNIKSEIDLDYFDFMLSISHDNEEE